jgi:hypothetical protein
VFKSRLIKFFVKKYGLGVVIRPVGATNIKITVVKYDDDPDHHHENRYFRVKYECDETWPQYDMLKRLASRRSDGLVFVDGTWKYNGLYELVESPQTT